MVITLADWQFSVDRDATLHHSAACSLDHCTCAYCRNYYEAVDAAHPRLRPVLDKFGVHLNGPSEVMPFEPALVAACYKITGQILARGETFLHMDDVPLRPENLDGQHFHLWVGPVELPWTQETEMDEVLSPANQPEFLDRMMQRLLLWAEDADITN